MASPRAAAAVILVRQQPELEVFWVRRSPRMVFQGGFHAFPGGSLESGESPEVGAARELEEEIGVKVSPAALQDMGRWITPAFAPRRFDTLFFLAGLPAGQEPGITSGELDIGEWIRPENALRQWSRGQALIAPPVQHALRALAVGLEGLQERVKSNPCAQGAPVHEIDMRPGVVLVPVRTPTLPPATHTNCYVVGGAEFVVIDPASPYPEEQRILDSVIERRVSAGCRFREIWLTHLHRDHVSGANHLREQWNVRVAAHPITRDDLRGVVHVDRTFNENERLTLQGEPGWQLSIHHTPGHARGHVCVFEENHRSLITGDLMAGVGTIVIDPPEGHMATYMASLERMKALRPTALFPSHGPVMANAETRIEEYIQHRQWREEKILDAWNQGARQIRSIVEAVYTDVPAAMHGLAERSVSAHLEKLRDDGRIH